MVIVSSFSLSDRLVGDGSSDVGGIDPVRRVGVEELNEAAWRTVRFGRAGARSVTYDSKDRSPS